MAGQKNNKRSNKKNQSDGAKAIVVFWIVFIIVIICIFMANAQTIQKNFNLFKTRLTTSPGAEQELLAEDEEIEELTVETPSAAQEPVVTGPSAGTQTTATEQPSASMPPSSAPATPQTTQQTRPQTQTSVPLTSAPAQIRERTVYFTQIDRDGHILQSRVVRRIPASDSPMQDVLNALLMGPTAEELNRGIINLIPQNTRLLRAQVQGSTAYLSLSEDFLFNTFGVEGYVAQLRQIVWTVTEFTTVSDVQILIEGRRLDYLGEGIWIGSPISRQSF